MSWDKSDMVYVLGQYESIPAVVTSLCVTLTQAGSITEKEPPLMKCLYKIQL